MDRLVLERALVEHGRERLALAERADAAGDVAGGALGLLDVGHLRLLALDGRGERLEVELVLDRHDRDGELAVDVGDERLEDRRRVQARALGGLEPVGLVLGVVLVGVRRDRDLRPARAPSSPVSPCCSGDHLRTLRGRRARALRSRGRSPSCGSSAGRGAGTA